jgi:hypothetical protein
VNKQSRTTSQASKAKTFNFVKSASSNPLANLNRSLPSGCLMHLAPCAMLLTRRGLIIHDPPNPQHSSSKSLMPLRGADHNFVIGRGRKPTKRQIIIQLWPQAALSAGKAHSLNKVRLCQVDSVTTSTAFALFQYGVFLLLILFYFGDLRFCLPTQSTSGWTTRICLVSASLREKVFSSVHK